SRAWLGTSRGLTCCASRAPRSASRTSTKRSKSASRDARKRKPMLPREVMGVLCLGVVWMTALLVAGAAWQDLRDLRAIVRRAKNAIRGTVIGGDLAEWAVEQTGRATDDDAIAFHDREFHCEILG